MSVLMRPVTSAEIAATAADRFRSQYRDWRPDDRFSDGKTKEDVDKVFNTSAHTPEVVAGILNVGWAYPQCSGCGGHFGAVVTFKEEWSDDSWSICLECVGKAATVLAQLPGATVKPAPSS